MKSKITIEVKNLEDAVPFGIECEKNGYTQLKYVKRFFSFKRLCFMFRVIYKK